MRPTATFVLLLFVSALVHGQEPPEGSDTQPQLTLDDIFTNQMYSSETFGPARWLGDGAGYTTLEKNASGATEIVQYDSESGERDVLVSASQLVPTDSATSLPIDDYYWSADGARLLVFTNSKRVWRLNTRGDYWVLDLDSGGLTKLGGPDARSSTLMFAKFSPDGNRVGYVREHNIYIEDLGGGGIIQLTSDGSETLINGTFDWVYEEEFHVRDGWRWSPDGQTVSFWQIDASGIGEFLMINNTDSLYSFTIPVQYPKTGTTNSACRVGAIPASGGEIVWFEPSDDLRNHYIARMEWAASSSDIVLQHLPRKQNRVEVILGDVSTGEMNTILVDEDDAWIDIRNDMRWLDKGAAFSWVSDRDGWRRMYRVSRDGSSIEAISPPGVDIMGEAHVDEAAGWIYYVAGPDDPTRRYLYRVRVDGGSAQEAERITPDEPGTHSYQIAPGSQWAIHTYSSFDSPTRIDLVSLPDHEVKRHLVTNDVLQERLSGLQLGETDFFRVDIGDGVELDGWIIKPSNFDESRKYPVFYFVYGEPASQIVRDRWMGSRGLWHRYIAEQGYLVISIDNRGTPSPRGRDFRKIVYGSIGVLASADQAAAARAINAWPYVDHTRIGIWGWSGGGSMTLNAMFRYPDVYNTGMSVAPVPDQHYYDTIYQERYMGTPQDNPEGYYAGSPVNFAHQLEGNLLLVHGTGDDNVHYQGSEALINELVKHNKYFSFMAYPNRTHGIREGAGTTRHVYGTLTRYLNDNLPPGSRPEVSQ